MQGLAGQFGRWGRVALNLLLPPQCMTCDTPVDAPGRFCAACFVLIQFISDPCCDGCGRALELPRRPSVCARCAEAPPPWGRARAAMEYDTHSRTVLLALKHGDRPELAQALAGLMVRAGAGMLGAGDLLVPVPLHPSRLRSRRYNQSALLARAIGLRTGIERRLDALVRIRVTQPLGELSAARRHAVLDGAIQPRRGAALDRRRVVLVDDVLTSGATAGACTAALLAAGAASVDLLVAARVPDPRPRQDATLANGTFSSDVRDLALGERR